MLKKINNLSQLKSLDSNFGLNKSLQKQKLFLNACRYFMAQKIRKLVNIWQGNGDFLKHNHFIGNFWHPEFGEKRFKLAGKQNIIH